jgi:hypothetical protein
MFRCFVTVTNYHLDRTREVAASETFELGSECCTKLKPYNIKRNTFHWIRL